MLDQLTSRDEKTREQNSPAAAQDLPIIYSSLDSQIEQFNRKLEDIESRYYNLQEDRNELIQATTQAMHAMSHVFEAFETEVKETEMIREAQISLRQKTHKFFEKSYFMNRARMWPQGYAGDYLTLEGVYRNTPMSEGIGYCLDSHFLSSELGTAVRGRLAMLTELIKTELTGRRQPRILSIACGSCRELFTLAPEIKQSNARIMCLDFDSDALAYSANRQAFTDVEPEQLKYRQYNALKMVNHERNLKEFGMQDVIYSTGFFDYLDDELLARLLNASYKLVDHGGTLIASFKDCRRYRAQEYHWFVDWNGFYQRTESDMHRVLNMADIPEVSMQMHRDSSGVICFFLVTKE